MLEVNGLRCACAEKPIDLCVQLERELADVTAERDAEREARRVLQAALSELITIYESDNCHTDSYGVEGSDWAVCDLCEAEDKPGIFAAGIPHEQTCPIFRFNAALALAAKLP